VNTKQTTEKKRDEWLESRILIKFILIEIVLISELRKVGRICTDYSIFNPFVLWTRFIYLFLCSKIAFCFGPQWV